MRFPEGLRPLGLARVFLLLKCLVTLGAAEPKRLRHTQIDQRECMNFITHGLPYSRF